MPASRVTVNTWAVEDADGNKLRRRIVAVLHAGEGGGSVDGLLIAKWAEATTDATTGIATFQLYSNDDIDQAGSFYSFTVCDVDPTVVRRYAIPAGATANLPDLTEVEPVGFSGYVPNPASGTAGDVLTVASDGTYELGTLGGSGSVADGAITTAKLAADAVTAAKIATDAVGSSEIAAGAVGSSELADGGVTLAKMADVATARILGRTTAGTGVPEALTAAQARSLLGLVVGTDVQAYSSILASLVSNGAPGTTGLAVLLASTAAAARSTLGVNQQRTTRILFSVDEPLTYTTWTPTAATVQGAGYSISANANTESWTYEVWLDSGTHKVRSVVRKHVRGPIITFSLSGGIGTIGTHDTYNGSSLGDQATTLTSSLAITTPGFYTLTMTNSTRNASNTTGWDMTPQVLTFTRTGS